MYRKIEIHSESDLPKEEGTYTVFLEDGEIDIFRWQKANIGFLTKDWMYYAKAYLLPLSEPEESESRKELIKYMDWYESDENKGTSFYFKSNEELVDEYLQSRKSKR